MSKNWFATPLENFFGGCDQFVAHFSHSSTRRTSRFTTPLRAKCDPISEIKEILKKIHYDSNLFFETQIFLQSINQINQIHPNFSCYWQRIISHFHFFVLNLWLLSLLLKLFQAPQESLPHINYFLAQSMHFPVHS